MVTSRSAFKTLSPGQKAQRAAKGRPSHPNLLHLHTKRFWSSSPFEEKKSERPPLTSSHTEQHPEDFADQGPETDDSGHLHPIQIAFDLGYPRTCCHWLEEEAHTHTHSNHRPHQRDNLLAWASDSAGLRGDGRTCISKK